MVLQLGATQYLFRGRKGVHITACTVDFISKR